jgi:hypothetical protein
MQPTNKNNMSPLHLTQEFTFDIKVEVNGGALVIIASFTLQAIGVNPAQTLADISTSLSTTLSNSSGDFESIASSFGSAFDSAAELFAEIAQSDKIHLSLNANINVDARLELSFDSFQLSTSVNKLDASFTGSISDEFVLSIGNVSINVTPFVQLYLEVKNTAVPFDVVQNPSALSELSFGGNFIGLVVVRIPELPFAISLRALSQDITNTSSLEFELRLDIDLVPIKDSE